MEPLFEVRDLHAEVDGKEILKGVSLRVDFGEIHAIMGPNGSGKTTLASAIMGHPSYSVTAGRILFNGEDITELKPEERARKGMFLGFQYPTAVPGVTVANFLRTALKSVSGNNGRSVKGFRKLLREKLLELGMGQEFGGRYLNDGFSGGEKKRLEVLQMGVLDPSMAILDETDSGLDIDALRIVAEGINRFAAPEKGILLITHYQRLLGHVRPDRVHVLKEGRIERSGGPELALELEKTGYLSKREA